MIGRLVASNSQKKNFGIRREDIMEILPEIAVLSGKILEGLKFDSFDGLGEYFEGSFF